jgi:hypothetical protein
MQGKSYDPFDHDRITGRAFSGKTPEKPGPVAPVVVMLERPVPQGVHIEHGQQRASNILRDRYINALTECHVDGRLNDAEHKAREQAAEKAVTEADLRLLLDDLPGLPLTRSEEETAKQKRARKKAERGHEGSIWSRKEEVRIFTYLLMIATGVATTLVPAVIAGNIKHTYWIGPAIVTAAVIIGLSLIIWGIVMTSTDKLWYKSSSSAGFGKKRHWG